MNFQAAEEGGLSQSNGKAATEKAATVTVTRD